MKIEEIQELFQQFEADDVNHFPAVRKMVAIKNTIEYPGEWEALYNPDFNYTEFGTIKNEITISK